MIQLVKTNESGQALIEFALVLPILLLILFGIIEFGRIFHTNIIVDQATRAGARVATVDQDEAAIKAAVISAGEIVGIQANQITVSYCHDPVCNDPIDTVSETVGRGDSAIVKVDYELELLTPLIRPFLANENGMYEVNSRTVMRVE